MEALAGIIAMEAPAGNTAMGEVYIEKLSAFGRMLRREGLAAAPRDTEDAARLLAGMDLSDRAKVKTALKTVYASTREEQLIFDRVFDGFFLSEEAMRAQAREQMERERQRARERQQAQDELDEMENRVRLDSGERESYKELPEDARKKLREFLEKYKANVDRSPHLYSEFIHSVFAKALLEQQMRMENAGTGVEEQDPEMGLLYRDIGEFKDSEIPKAISMIQAVARQINGELSAHRQAGAHSGKLDFRRTIRRSLSTGGSLHDLRFRKKHPRKKRLVLLCDVSGSMMQFSEFALRFIQSLNQVAESSRTFLFSETVVEADAFQLQNMDRFRTTVRESGIYGRGTDLGTALETLCAFRPPILNGSTTLIILSDSKTVDTHRAVLALQEAKRLSGRVLWLNPIPERNWKYLKSTMAVRQVCPMIPCSTLKELEDACRKLARA